MGYILGGDTDAGINDRDVNRAGAVEGLALRDRPYGWRVDHRDAERGRLLARDDRIRKDMALDDGLDVLDLT